MTKILVNFGYKSTQYQMEKIYYKSYSFCREIYYMLQRQIEALGKQMDIEDAVCINYVITSFHSIVWIFIAVIVTIYRTALIQRYQSTSHFIMLRTTLLRSCI